MPLANYPETVALTGLLSDPAVVGQPVWRSEASLERFCAELGRRLRIPYEPYYSRDPLLQFLDEQRRASDHLLSLDVPGIGPSLTDVSL